MDTSGFIEINLVESSSSSETLPKKEIIEKSTKKKNKKVLHKQKFKKLGSKLLHVIENLSDLVKKGKNYIKSKRRKNKSSSSFQPEKYRPDIRLTTDN